MQRAALLLVVPDWESHAELLLLGWLVRLGWTWFGWTGTWLTGLSWLCCHSDSPPSSKHYYLCHRVKISSKNPSNISSRFSVGDFQL